jgi:hypothetical protein
MNSIRSHSVHGFLARKSRLHSVEFRLKRSIGVTFNRYGWPEDGLTIGDAPAGGWADFQDCGFLFRLREDSGAEKQNRDQSPTKDKDKAFVHGESRHYPIAQWRLQEMSTCQSHRSNSN